MLKNWKPKLLTLSSFLIGVITWLQFCEISARTLLQQMTAHYIFLIVALMLTALFFTGIYWWWISTRTTKKNVQLKVRSWLDAFNLTHNIVKWDAWIWGFDYRPPQGAWIFIAQTKERPDHLQLVGRLSGLSPDQRRTYNDLKKHDKINLDCQLLLEMARVKMAFYTYEELKRIEIVHQIPITSKLTQTAFMNALSEVFFASNIIWNTIYLHLGVTPIEPTQPSSTPDTEALPPSQAS